MDKKTESISCVFPKNVNANTIADTISNIENIIDVSLTDAYNGPQIDEEHISLTFEVTALTKQSIENVKKLFTGFGGIIR